MTRCPSERRTGRCGPAVRSRSSRRRTGTASRRVDLRLGTSTTRQESSCPSRRCGFPPRTARPTRSPPSPTAASGTGDLTPEALGELNQALDAAGVGYTSEIYPGTVHGFTMADTDAFNAAGLKRHWDRLLPLLEHTLGNG
ncbi:dienelactone hydrolase family protein [Spongiactinospora sp. TRM90649]|uniref:dienelactone hydrolase family protein n=1 Tax=Spongiactinospora sp. TRM90649 TaxID=3031114 RepID=UPI0023F62339|nr:dienelactone hydrolase family protein [Spongiactinospora sp. TRM90649]MDF5753295.1 dienelactone hydrolase family protein [Spongiactinospora sp. TRM90649]